MTRGWSFHRARSTLWKLELKIKLALNNVCLQCHVEMHSLWSYFLKSSNQYSFPLSDKCIFMTCFSHKRRKRDITKWRAFPLLARHTVLVGQRANAATVKQQSWIVKAAEFQFMTHIHKNLHAQKYWSWLAVETVRQRDIFTKSQRAFRWAHVLRDPLWTRDAIKSVMTEEDRR